MSFRQAPNKSTQSSKVEIRAAGMALSPSTLQAFIQISSLLNTRSVAAELRHALLAKRLKSFQAIGRKETRHLLADFLVQQSLECFAFRFKKHSFHRARCQRRCR